MRYLTDKQKATYMRLRELAGNNPEIVSQALKSSVNCVGLVDAKTLVSQIIKLKGQNDNSIS